jgi:hypothetical protein
MLNVRFDPIYSMHEIKRVAKEWTGRVQLKSPTKEVVGTADMDGKPEVSGLGKRETGAMLHAYCLVIVGIWDKRLSLYGAKNLAVHLVG